MCKILVMDEDQKAAISLLDEAKEATGLDLTGLARQCGVAPSTFTRFYSGRVKHSLSDRTQRKIRSVMASYGKGSSGISGELFPVPTAARRFKAARWGWYGDNQARAAEHLGIGSKDLDTIEAGEVAAPDALLMRFNAVSGIPLWWFLEGRWDGIGSELAGRIGAFDPDLIAEEWSAAGAHQEEGHSERRDPTKTKARP